MCGHVQELGGCERPACVLFWFWFCCLFVVTIVLLLESLVGKKLATKMGMGR